MATIAMCGIYIHDLDLFSLKIKPGPSAMSQFSRQLANTMTIFVHIEYVINATLRYGMSNIAVSLAGTGFIKLRLFCSPLL